MTIRYVRKILTFCFAAFVLIVLSYPTHDAKAADEPKPLTADIPSSAKDKSKNDPYALPQDLIDLRKQNKVDYNQWLKEDAEVQKECSEARTQVDRLACEQKKKVSQRKYDVVEAKTRDMVMKIDNWRRKQRGLPPSDEWAPKSVGQNNGTYSNLNSSYGSNSNTSPNKNNSVLLPTNNDTLPKNMY